MKNIVNRRNLPMARYYTLRLNLVLGIYNVGILFMYYQNWFAFIIGMLNIGVYLFYRERVKKEFS